MLDENSIEQLAAVLAPKIADRLRAEQEQSQDKWLSTREAALYIGRSVSSLHKLTAAREIPFEQEGPGCKCWFLKSELDNWMSS